METTLPLTVQGLGCRRGQSLVLRDVSFSVTPGHALILRGPNGAGKTTLLRTLAGLTPSQGGTISLPFDAIAYGAHADGLKLQLTVRENLSFWASAFGSGTSGVEQATATFDLAPLLDRRAADLSAGQRRRAGLARMVLTDRPVWLLDEPTVSLDTQRVDAFAATMRAHLAAGGIALLATHIDLGLDAKTLDIAQFAAATRAPTDPVTDPFAEAVE